MIDAMFFVGVGTIAIGLGMVYLPVAIIWVGAILLLSAIYGMASTTKT